MSTITRVLKHLAGIDTTGHFGGCQDISLGLRDALILEHFPARGTALSQSGRAHAAAVADDALQVALLGDIGGSQSIAPSSTGTSRKRAHVSQVEDEDASASAGGASGDEGEEFDRMYKEKIQNLPAQDTREYMDHEEDYEASYAMALKAMKSVFVRKGLEIAVIANSDNGSNFFRLCISFPSWGERGCKMTTFRVSEIARAHITSQEKCRLLGLLASGNAALKETGIPSNDKPFSQWLRMHVYWWQLERLLGSLLYTRQMDPNARLGSIRLMWADLPTHCKVDAGFGRVSLWNVFTDGIVQSMDTLIVAMFVRDLDGPLHVSFYDRRAGDIAAKIDGYEADSDMLREPLRESSWTLDTSGGAFRSDVEKSEFFARWLIGTFTTVGDVVLDWLARCGSMATECERLHWHYISIEKDVVVFRSLLFPQQCFPGEVGTVLHYGHFSRSEELERSTSLQPLAQPSIPHFYLPPTPQPPDIAQWPYGPSYPPPYTFTRPHSAWPPAMGGRPPLQRLQRPLFSPPPMEPPPPPPQL
ncbi:hypothetical protein L7F22_009480 [Adiantum nelumboides]|nr:hypothetical protein [Adiantum nelumboides]